MDARSMARMVAPFARQLSAMLARGSVLASGAAARMQQLQVSLLAGEVKADIEHAEPYGFTSNPHDGAEVVAVFLGGDRSHGLVIVASDRRYRLQGLAKGEVALYSDEGDRVVLKRGRVIELVTHTLNIKADAAVNIESPLVTVTGSLDVEGSGFTHAGVNVGNSHVHPVDGEAGITGHPE